MKLNIKIVFGLALFTQVASAPLSSTDIEILHDLTFHLESLQPIVPRQDDDDDESNTLRNVFPGVSSILLGVVTGDLRRIFEDGIFSFLSKNAQTQAFAIFHNLLGRTTLAPTTPTTATKRPRNSTSRIGGSTTITPPGLSRRPTLNYHRVPTSTGLPGIEPKSTTIATTSTTIDPEEEEEFADRFEQALLPHLPANPEDAIPQDFPQFI